VAVVKLLLDTGMVGANMKDERGQTPLSWAAENWHKAVVKLLLKKGLEAGRRWMDTLTTSSRSKSVT
jgi:ankyrin repeat protein